MPIQIDRAKAHDLTLRFDEALELVRNEFEGIDHYRQYRNAFARLLKPDPLGRVLMTGTDQRDLFAPELRRVIKSCVPVDGHIFDFGAGDGQTFALVAGSVPKNTRISIEEPNPGYVADYSVFLKTQAHLRPGIVLVAGVNEMDAAAARSGASLPQDGSVDLGLALHMIYFLKDLPAGVTRMVRFLKPGGALFVVFADDIDSYVGLVVNRVLEADGGSGDKTRHLATIAERRCLLGSPADGGGAILEVLRNAGIAAELDVQRQPSRLYGHSLSDLIAMMAALGIVRVENAVLFETATALLRHDPETVDLRIEDDGPRKGMWSVAQPQWVSVIHRSR
jgi:SAM-dependent methyltransferase